ncbi:DNA-3-methyladenine glycosylase I [Gordonia alkaliphila]|uniref:DNA-3-methyladenine glycosylase I n=1 Tax=Gordonia alkaliphila TaxID=1053547 RepID=UPI001FF1604B|nr:DNA-3-methyladenine glycosylase I [Gordonia alkaliphila]MCK0440653.1 DNA-3-methyladenine glycosylase I [Gordonia alkaliphila]
MDLYVAPDGQPRCGWAADGPLMLGYHDTEWGFPVHDDHRLFEKVSLEGFQSGLSWRTILTKRPAFREVFEGFDPVRVALFTDDDVERLLTDARIIRHRGKIEAVVNNAARALELMDDAGSLAAYFWTWAPPAGEIVAPATMTTSPSSIAMAKDLKKRGWKFVGPTTAFAFMQAMGLINDHAEGCTTRGAVEEARHRL